MRMDFLFLVDRSQHSATTDVL